MNSRDLKMALDVENRATGTKYADYSECLPTLVAGLVINAVHDHLRNRLLFDTNAVYILDAKSIESADFEIRYSAGPRIGVHKYFSFWAR